MVYAIRFSGGQVYQKLFYNKKTKKGFTLIELMVVIAVIGVFALMGLLFYLGQQVKAEVNVDMVQFTIQAEEFTMKQDQT